MLQVLQTTQVVLSILVGLQGLGTDTQTAIKLEGNKMLILIKPNVNYQQI